MDFEVEFWNSSDYPSHWNYEDSFKTLEEARKYISSKKDGYDYRIIQEIPLED